MDGKDLSQKHLTDTDRPGFQGNLSGPTPDKAAISKEVFPVRFLCLFEKLTRLRQSIRTERGPSIKQKQEKIQPANSRQESPEGRKRTIAREETESKMLQRTQKKVITKTKGRRSEKKPA